jgi:hypothetical protein
MEKELKKKRGGNRHPTIKLEEIKETIASYPLVNKPKVRLPLTVSARGTGLCMYIPKETCDLFGIIAGHVLVVQIDEHHMKRREDDAEQVERKTENDLQEGDLE